jgi:hypothetical protein
MHFWIRTTARLATAAAVLMTLLVTLVAPSARAADPTTVDCLSASEKALALRGEHKLRGARAQLLVCASANCPADIRKECARRVDEVNASIPTIVIGAKDPTGNDLSAVKVTMDGEVLTEKLEGSAISLDPGAHTFTFQTAGQPLLTKQIVVREGEKDRREMVQLGNRPAPLPVPLPVKPVVVAVPVKPAPPPSKPLSKRRVAALAVGGFGVVGLGVGAAFGGLALSSASSAKAVCPGSGCLTQQGVNLWNTAHLDGTVSTIGLVVGGVALAGGVALWFTDSSPAKPRSAQLGVGPGSVVFKEVW